MSTGGLRKAAEQLVVDAHAIEQRSAARLAQRGAQVGARLAVRDEP